MKEIEIKPTLLEVAKPKFQSANFWTAIITILFGYLASQNIDVNIAPHELVAKIMSGSNLELIVILAMNLGTPAFKLIDKMRKGLLTWGSFKSSNFTAQIGALIAIGIGWYFGEVTTGLIVSVVISGMNFVIHLMQKK